MGSVCIWRREKDIEKGELHRARMNERKEKEAEGKEIRKQKKGEEEMGSRETKR